MTKICGFPFVMIWQTHVIFVFISIVNSCSLYVRLGFERARTETHTHTHCRESYLQKNIVY